MAENYNNTIKRKGKEAQDRINMENKIYKWIKITKVGVTESGKTNIYDVQTQDLTDLGKIKWNAGWRRYSFYPESYSYYEQDCLRDIADFLDILKRMRLKGNNGK